MSKKKRTQFLNKPQFIGDKQVLDDFIAQTLVYPQEAVEKNIQGNVHVAYSVNEKGDVVETKIKRGIGAGCDEEAMRVVRLLKFRAARNPGTHITVHATIVIRFRLKKKPEPVQFVYEYKPSPPEEVQVPSAPPALPKPGVTTLTLTFPVKPTQ